jgi:NAD(P)H-dependent FMN reductase
MNKAENNIEKLKILIFNGTMRKGQYTEYVTNLVKRVAEKRTELILEIIDPRQLNLKFDDEGNDIEMPSLTDKVVRADGYIIVAPEYNHGYPGSLKYVLDLNQKEYIHKSVGFVGVAKGAFGGTRVIEALVNVVRELGLVAIFNDVNFSYVKKEIIDGKVLDSEKWERRIDRMLDELIWMAKTLKHGRDNIQSEYS